MGQNPPPSTEYSLQTLWFSVPDPAGRVRVGYLCGVRWRGQWPLDSEVSEALVPEAGVLDELALRLRHAPRFSQSVLGRFALAECKHRAGAVAESFCYSLSHSGRTAVALGFEASSCGVDLELGSDADRSPKVVRKFASAVELEFIKQEALSPWALWCAKESLGKALGTGLTAPLSQYAVRSIEAGVMEFDHFPGYRARAWDLRRGPSESAHFALALPGVETPQAQSALRDIPIIEWAERLLGRG